MKINNMIHNNNKICYNFNILIYYKKNLIKKNKNNHININYKLIFI